jgi:hypothetical protein
VPVVVVPVGAEGEAVERGEEAPEGEVAGSDSAVRKRPNKAMLAHQELFYVALCLSRELLCL